MTGEGAIPRRLPLVRTAIYRHVPMERWGRVVDHMVEIASTEGKQAVQAATFLATHCPAPDELDSDDTLGVRTRIAGPEQIDEWSALLAQRFGMPLNLLILALQALRTKLDTPKDEEPRPEPPTTTT